MPTNYPGALDTFSNPVPTDAENSAGVPHAAQHANANDAIEAIEAELGVNPSGSAPTVAERFNGLSLSGGLADVNVTGAATGQVLTKTSGGWEAATPATGGGSLPRVGWKISRVANQSIPNATVTAIAFDTEPSDPQGFHATNANSIVVPATYAGIYVVSLHASFLAGTSGRSFVNINAPGSLIMRTSFGVNGEGLTTLTGVVALAVGDTLSCEVYQASGAANNFTAVFEGYRLGV